MATLGIVLALACSTALAWLAGSRVVGDSDAVLAMLYAGTFVALLVSATLSRTQFRTTNRPAIAILSNISGVSALFLVPYVAIAPRFFSPSGFGFGASTSHWLWIAWHAAFALLALIYAVFEATHGKRVVETAVAHAIGRCIACVATISAGLTVAAILVFHARLPNLDDGNGFSPFFHTYVEPAMLAVAGIVFLALAVVTRLRTTPSLWLTIVLLAYVVQSVVGGEFLHGSATLAWYVVFVPGLVCPAVYLLAQLRTANEQLAAFAADKQSLIEVTMRDPLTNLLNRRGFDERFEEILSEARLRGTSASIVLFDIDHFKVFNDTFGHPAGDEALKKIAAAVAGVANRPTDACCRVGGEEFAIVLGATDASGAMTLAERVRSTVMRLKLPQNPQVASGLTVSVGTATSFAHAVVDSAELYARADKALYKAKRLGRNRIATHDVMRDDDLALA